MSSPGFCEIKAVRDQKDVATYVIEPTYFNLEIKFILQDCLEAVVASEVAKRAFTSNMHVSR